jgi:predicted lipoprotein with Yx(FWY)xxD motif
MTRSRSTAYLVSAAALLLAVLAVAGCGGGSSNALPTTQNGQPATLGVADDDLGEILVNSQGRTLYLFEKDSGTTSACTGECASDWPPLEVTGKATEGSGADSSLVGTTERPDGTQQVTYNGHPLYLFEGDKKAGDTNGEGLNAFGGSWLALSAVGNGVTPQAPSQSGGSGY